MIGRTVASAIRGYIWYSVPHPGRGILGRFARRIDSRVIYYEVWPGVQININSESFYDHIAAGQLHEHRELTAFTSHLRPGMTVLDVGANIGLYTCAAARTVGVTGRVYAFEPMPSILQNLSQNAAANNLTNIVFEQLALSDSEGLRKFHVGSSETVGSLVRPSGSARTLEVKTTTIDQYLESKGIEQVDAVKIDVEGGEPLVIRGMTRTLSRRRKPILLVEHNHPALTAAGSSAAELFATLVGYGYRAHAITHKGMTTVTQLVKPSRRFGEPLMNYVFLPELA